jgi:hypothetical protein
MSSSTNMMTTTTSPLDLELDLDVNVEQESDWLETYKAELANADNFYTEDVTNIELHYIFIDLNNEVTKLKSTSHELTNNALPGHELLNDIKAVLKDTNMVKDTNITQIKYKVAAILRYNIDLVPDEIMDFVTVVEEEDDEEDDDDDIFLEENFLKKNNKEDHKNDNSGGELVNIDYNARFLKIEKQVTDIKFDKTINIFQDLNALFIVLKAQLVDTSNANTTTKKPFTKKIKLRVPHVSHSSKGTRKH